MALKFAGGLFALVVLAASLLLGAGARHHLYYDMLYSVVARHAIADASTDVERVDALSQYTFSNVHLPTAPLIDNDGPPAETLLGGYGYCDQQVRLFMALAQKVGLSTREVFLLDTDTGTSPHTVAEAQEDSRWGLVDVFYGYTPKRHDGSPATLAEVVARNDPIIRMVGLKLAYYEHTRVQLQMDGDGVWRFVWQLLPEPMLNLIQDVYLLMPPPNIPVQSGFSPIDAPDGRLYWSGRNFQLFGRSERATAAFQKLLASYPNSSYANDARYNLAMLARSAAPKKALYEVAQVQSHEPTPTVSNDALLVAGEVYQESRRRLSCLKAIDVLSRVATSGTSSAAAATFRLSSTPCTSALPRPLADFGPLALVGVKMDGDSVSLLWHVTEPMSRNYTVFVHALDETGHVIAQDDSQPYRGSLPTSRLHPGELVPDDHPMTLPSSTANLEVGVYYLPTEQRLTQSNDTDAFRMRVEDALDGVGVNAFCWSAANFGRPC